jgi:hypothetical protein
VNLGWKWDDHGVKRGYLWGENGANLGGIRGESKMKLGEFGAKMDESIYVNGILME